MMSELSHSEVILKIGKLSKENVSAYQCKTKRFKTIEKLFGFKVTSVQTVLQIAHSSLIFTKRLLMELQCKSTVVSFTTNLLRASQQTA